VYFCIKAWVFFRLRFINFWSSQKPIQYTEWRNELKGKTDRDGGKNEEIAPVCTGLAPWDPKIIRRGTKPGYPIHPKMGYGTFKSLFMEASSGGSDN